jgi:diadenosine tetraphosphate (Ap4A) HIT family hydrolase
MAFQLHPRLEKGGFSLGKLGICRVLLKDNALFPWYILVPETDEDITEFHDLPESEAENVMRAVRRIAHFIGDHYRPDKVNIGILGNQVPQLHVHVIGRFETDPAWPGAVWSCTEKQPYSASRVAQVRRIIRPWLDSTDAPDDE